MLVTEEQAKEMWCPEARLARATPGGDVPGGQTVFNRVQTRDENTGIPLSSTCIASKCMFWRKVDQIGIGPRGEKRDRDHDGRTRWVDRGYCGLAGKP